MMVLAIDPATRCGWAAGRTGGVPEWGSRNFSSGEGTGAVLGLFRHWFNQRCYDFKPALVAFESPYIPRQQPGGIYKGPPINTATVRRLMGFTSVIEMASWELRIECREARPSEIAKFFIGAPRVEGGREAKKAATVEMCRAYGWDVDDDDNAADALALWAKAEQVIDRQAAASRRAAASAALEDLRMRSAAGEATPTALKSRSDERKSSNGPRQQQFTNF